MLENVKAAELTVFGRLVLSEEDIEVNGFAGNDETSCRDVAMLACIWGIGLLQKEIAELARAPGGGISGIGDSPCEWYPEVSVRQTLHTPWAVACDQDFSFTLPVGTSPSSQGMKYCPKCGKPIDIVENPDFEEAA